MFQFPGLAFMYCYINITIARDGLSHSGTCGSIRICQSPQIFAACRALLRLREPRHPPYALCNFLSLFFKENPYIGSYNPLVTQFLLFLMSPLLLFSHHAKEL